MSQPITLTSAMLFHLDPIRIEPGGLRIEGRDIVAVGAETAPQPGDEIIDCGGAVVLPGLVNGHTHLYSALAAGMPPPPRAPQSFHEILKYVWWRLDRALDGDSIEISGRIGALDALSCGTTTLIDHHASPSWIDGSLDRLEKGIADIGLRAVLCYETTDRNGGAGFEAGLNENRRYLDRCRMRGGGRYGALVGAHAAFTLSDASLRACVELAEEYASGVHIHAAEDPCDDAICRAQYGAPLLERFRSCGLLSKDDASEASVVGSRSIMGHGTHLRPDDAARVSSQWAGIAHNARSNMNNAVGYAPVPHMCRVLLGTDGIGGDLFAESRAAWFKYRDAQHASNAGSGAVKSGSTGRAANCGNDVTPARILEMLAQSARTASAVLNRRIGLLSAGSAADVVVTDYVPATPLASENAAGHFHFALAARHVLHVLVDGELLLKDRVATRLNTEDIRTASRDEAARIWQRMSAISIDE